jgi:hypothetical protein
MKSAVVPSTSKGAVPSHTPDASSVGTEVS